MTIDSAITVVGNLTADPSLRFDPQGRPQAKFNVAVSRRRYDRQTNEWVDADTTFMTCEVWGDEAEHVAESLVKGQRVVVTGRLQTKRWTTKDDQKRERIELRVDDVGVSLKYGTTTFKRAQSNAGVYRQPDPTEAPF